MWAYLDRDVSSEAWFPDWPDTLVKRAIIFCTVEIKLGWHSGFAGGSFPAAQLYRPQLDSDLRLLCVSPHVWVGLHFPSIAQKQASRWNGKTKLYDENSGQSFKEVRAF